MYCARWPSLRELTTRATSGIFDLRGSIQSLLENLGDSGERVDRMVRTMVMDMDPNLMDRRLSQTELLDIAGSGYPPGVSIAVLVGLSTLCAFVVLRQITKPVRI